MPVDRAESAGQIGMFAQKFSIAKGFNHIKEKYVQVKFDTNTVAWNIYYNYEFIKSVPALNINKQNIENLSVMSKNKINQS